MSGVRVVARSGPDQTSCEPPPASATSPPPAVKICRRMSCSPGRADGSGRHVLVGDRDSAVGEAGDAWIDLQFVGTGSPPGSAPTGRAVRAHELTFWKFLPPWSRLHSNHRPSVRRGRRITQSERLAAPFDGKFAGRIRRADGVPENVAVVTAYDLNGTRTTISRRSVR